MGKSLFPAEVLRRTLEKSLSLERRDLSPSACWGYKIRNWGISPKQLWGIDKADKVGNAECWTLTSFLLKPTVFLRAFITKLLKAECPQCKGSASGDALKGRSVSAMSNFTKCDLKPVH